MTDDNFEVLITQALATIPERFRNHMNNVGIVIEEEVRPGQAGELPIRDGEVLLGLYQGVPLTRRGPQYGMVLPDKITLFKTPIVAIGKAEGGIRELVRDTVWHEIGHHFGMDETRIRKAEQDRKHKHAAS
ncbi:MAG: metallopeptidase family protein [Patescibacteria group bacterium]|jgi:predicted Zn-dependent protease with MMP-like domain